jgi:serine/threonine-protein kinase RsbW
MALTLPREAISVPLARGLLASTLERAGVAPQVLEDVKVALTEACTNAYQHVEAGETFEVQVGLDDEYVTIRVVDRGPGFTPRPPAPEVEPYADGGRGIHLIRALTDSAEFTTTSDADSGVVSMWKSVAWGEASPWQRASQPVLSDGDEPD